MITKQQLFTFASRFPKICLTVILLIGCAVPATAGSLLPPEPGQKDRCPVCGMFVYKYPDWIATVVLDNNTVLFFDGAKDLFKFYFDLKKYHPDVERENIADIYVTEYYDVKPIHARRAFYVIGSDVYGPMGRELIPLASEADARQFMQDHKGKRILKFDKITSAVIQKLD